MTTIAKAILLASSAAILAVTGMVSAVDAAKSGQRSGAKQHHSSAGKHSSGKRHGHYNRRRGNHNVAGRALRGVFIAGASSGCSYSYRKWQATGSPYWRSRYYDCRNG